MPQPQRVQVRDEVLASFGAVAHEMIGTIAEQIPAYSSLSPAQLAEVTAIAEWGTTRVLQLWADGGELTDADVQRFRGIGAARVLDGRPLPGVLRAYRLAGTHVVDTVERLGGDRIDVTDALSLARLWMSSIDTLSEALHTGHTSAAARLSGDRERAVADLLDDLLVGRQVTRTGLADRSRELGLSLESRVGLLVVTAAGNAVTQAAVVGLLAEVCPGHATRTLSGVRGGTGAAVLPSGAQVGDRSLAQRGWRGGLMTGLRVSDRPRAHRLATHLLDHAPPHAYAEHCLLGEADAQLVGLLTGQPDADAERLAKVVLADLLSPGEEHLRAGLEAFLRTGSATAAAEALGLHAQTMRYRLRRVRDVTGRDPRLAWDRLVLETAAVAAAASATAAPATRSLPPP